MHICCYRFISQRIEEGDCLDMAKRSRGGGYPDDAVNERKSMALFFCMVLCLLPTAFTTKLPVVWSTRGVLMLQISTLLLRDQPSLPFYIFINSVSSIVMPLKWSKKNQVVVIFEMSKLSIHLYEVYNCLTPLNLTTDYGFSMCVLGG